MNDGRIAGRGWQIIVVLLLLWAGIATAQQDPLGDLGGDTPEEDAPVETPPDEAPPEGTPAEEPPPAEEPAVDPDAGVAELPVEGELAGDGGLMEEELPPEEPAPSGEGGEMVVTGSRIRRSNFAQPAAVQIMDRKQLTQSGAQTMTDVVKTMSINSGSDLNTDVSTGTAGSAQFNLRGLGVSSTLVLMNGRRLPTISAVSDDGSTFVDINTVPLGLIERVEVLKGGASAIYGSDAVAGVVNMLTRKRMDGFEAHIGAQTTDDLDHHEWDVSLLGGAQGERTRVIAGLGYFKREPLHARDREFTDNDRNVSRLGWPSSYLRYGPDGRPRTETNPITGMLGGATFVDPGCGPTVPPGSSGAPSGTTVPRSGVEQTPSLRFCNFNFNDYFMLMINEERVNVYTSLEHDLSDHTMAFFEASYARSRASRSLSPSYALLTPIYVPADHMYNPTGDRLRIYGRSAGNNQPPYQTDYDSDTLHTVAGIGGDWGGLSDDLEEWEWEISGTWSGNRYQVFAQDVLTAELQGALDSCGPGDDPADCWNPFSFGPANSQEIIDRVTGELRSKSDSTLTTAGVDLTGPLFGLPGGDLKLAVGAQLRLETTKSNPDHESNQEAFIFLIGGPDWEAERRIAAGYGELLLPFFRGFELQAAGRFEDYDDVGSSMDPMFGISWTPATTFAGDEAPLASKVRLRGTFSTAFRAPSLLQGNGTLTALQEIFPYAPDMAGMPMQAAVATFTAVRTFGNPELSPQRSTTITGGFEWSPASGVLVEADYWNYSYEDIIIRENPQAAVAADFLNHSSPDITYDEITGQPSEIRVKFINDDEVMTHGIDFGLNARSDFGGSAGTFSAGVNGAYVLAYLVPQSSVPASLWGQDVVSCDSPAAMGAAPEGAMCDVAGSRNITTSARSLPRLRMQFPIGWSLDGHNAALNTNLIGSYTDDNDSDPTPMGRDYRAIDAWVTLDLQYSYRLEETEHMATTFRVGVTNLLDSDPPALNAGLGFDVTTHDPRGRLIYGKIIQEF